MCYTRNGVLSAVQAFGSIGYLISEAAAAAAIGKNGNRKIFFDENHSFQPF